MIYFWNYKKLAKDLKANRFTEKDKVIYLATYLVENMVSILFATHQQTLVYNTLEILYTLVLLMMLYSFYKINRSGDNQDFVNRYICLSLPIAIRMTIICLAPLLLIEAIIQILWMKFGHGFDPKIYIFCSSIIMSILTTLYTYLTTKKAFEIIASPSDEEKNLANKL